MDGATQVEQLTIYVDANAHSDDCNEATRDFLPVNDIISDRIATNANERSFYVADLQDIYRKHAMWLELLPRVRPFYAVKCNNLHEIVSFLSMLGTGFDCASKAEIDQVLALGVQPSQIIYANPCKTRSYIKHAQTVGVNLLTFDNELELHKVAALHPNAQLVLRIKGDDKSSRCKFNIKFGADLDKCRHLLELARDLRLQVVGVSFHNGSDCCDIEAYKRSIADSKLVFELGEQLGHSMRVLDIGGGFPGHQLEIDDAKFVSFDKLTQVINAALDEHFPEVDPSTGLATGYEIIAEPGRYYVASSMTFASMVIAKRVQRDEITGADTFSYYLNDGVYGAFNNVIFEHATPVPQLLSIKHQANHNNNSNSNNGNMNGLAAIRAMNNNNNSNNNNMNRNNNNKFLFDFANRNGGGRGALLQSSDERKHYSTVLWGPTCDSVDCIKRDFMFPELDVGEWIVFKNMGAYTCCLASNFNGFEKAVVVIPV